MIQPSRLKAEDVAIPRFTWTPGEAEAFALGSHARAREALDLGLSLSMPGFNIFVVGDDRTGRMSATIAYLKLVCNIARENRGDWLYLHNFDDEREPQAFRLAAGDGKRFVDSLDDFVQTLWTMLSAALNSDSHRERVFSLFRHVEEKMRAQQEDIRLFARERGFDLEQTASGVRLRRIDTSDAPPLESDRDLLVARLDRLEHEAGRLRSEAENNALQLDRQTLSALLAFEKRRFVEANRAYPLLMQWIDRMCLDMVDNIRLLWRRDKPEDQLRLPPRYRANLFIDRSNNDECVITEPNPTYENLFGRIEYMRVEGVTETNFTLIRPGSLHRANGGVLVLRADALVKDSTAWSFLKAALRDREIRIEELHRAGSTPLTGTPRPQAIPLDVKIVLVGSPDHYYRFFSQDSDFKTHFKVKADIDPDMPATKANLDCLGQMICDMAKKRNLACGNEAIHLLLGLAARWAGRQDMLTSRFELIEDLLSEASLHCKIGESLTATAVQKAWQARKRRDARAEERFHQSLARGHIAVQTSGAVVAQVNGLTVRDLGDFQFGRPSRLTARSSIGERGVVNIERISDLGGKTQQKGTLIVEGYLRGVFGQDTPISFDCSITFEQNYGGIDGDSASVAELIVIISSLSDLPVRQDYAVTGSFNQLGEVQSVGDVIEKVEGFFLATEANRKKGEYGGVLLPATNVGDLVLEDDVSTAMRENHFSILAISNVEEAIEFMIGMSEISCQAIYEKVKARLAKYDTILTQRRGRLFS